MAKHRSMYQSLDIYRKVPVDFLESTRRGSFLSISAILITATLLYNETRSFLSTQVVTDLVLDLENQDPKLRINFNVTMMDLKCDFVNLDSLSIFGEEQNVQQNILKRGIDQAGVKQQYMARNRKQNDIKMFDPAITESLDDILARKENPDTWELGADTFDEALAENRLVFVDYYAGWCSHCRALMPTWETLAEIMNTASAELAKEKLGAKKKELEEQATHDGAQAWTEEHLQHAETEAFSIPVLVAKVDCVDHHVLCSKYMIGAYPTLRLFVDGERYGGDFYGDRTVLSFTDYLATVEEQYLDSKGQLSDIHEMAEKLRKAPATGGEEVGGKARELKYRMDDIMLDDNYYRALPDDDSEITRGRYKHKIHQEWLAKDHPGCEVSGFLIVDRVPGNFHILARSSTHDLVPTMTNVSHEVNHLSFGDPYTRRKIEMGRIPDISSDLITKLKPIDGNVYMNYNLHEAYHHYMKIVTTNFKEETRRGLQGNKAYQVMSQSQLAYYKPDVVPEAKFQYDLSPVAVTFRAKERRWYDFSTSIMAIVGGMFTVISIIEGTVGTVVRQITRKKAF